MKTCVQLSSAHSRSTQEAGSRLLSTRNVAAAAITFIHKDFSYIKQCSSGHYTKEAQRALPGCRLFHDVFEVISDDVRLLQELAHVVREVLHRRRIEALQPACTEELHGPFLIVIAVLAGIVKSLLTGRGSQLPSRDDTAKAGAFDSAPCPATE